MTATKGLFGSTTAFIIAEVARFHNGSFGFARAFIDAAAEAGAEAITCRTHVAAEKKSEPSAPACEPKGLPDHDHVALIHPFD